MALDPKYQYRINKQTVNLTRGVFNVSNTGAFVAYESQIDKTKTETLMTGCPHCETENYWIDLAALDDAQDCIECEYCSFLAFPVPYKHRDTDDEIDAADPSAFQWRS